MCGSLISSPSVSLRSLADSDSLKICVSSISDFAGTCAESTSAPGSINGDNDANCTASGTGELSVGGSGGRCWCVFHFDSDSPGSGSMPEEKELGRGGRDEKFSRVCGAGRVSTGASNDPNEESKLDSLSFSGCGALESCAKESLTPCDEVSEVCCVSTSWPNDADSAPEGFSLNFASDSPGRTIEI